MDKKNTNIDGVTIFSKSYPKETEDELCERGIHSLWYDREKDQVQCRSCGKVWIKGD